jgi:tetratricopeptide (TPR) repeat protein
MNKKQNLGLKLFVFLGFVLFFLSPTAFAIDQDSIGKIKTFEELEKAIDQAKEVVRANPEDVEIHHRLARLLMKNGKFNAAEKSLNNALKIDKEHLPSIITLADLNRKRFRFDKAEIVLETVVELAPTSRAGHLLAARFIIDRMDFEGANEIYLNILKESTESAEALCGIAEIYYWWNDYIDAEEYIQKCLEVDPGFAPAYVIQSRIHRIRQDNDKWNEWGRKAVELDPFDDDARANLANILFRGEGKLREGYEQAKIALRINPYCHLAHVYLGNGWTPHDYEEQKIEGDEKTVAKIKELLKTGDKNLLERKFKKADQAFNKVLRMMPKNITAKIGKGTFNYHQEKYDEALPWFFQVLNINPDYGLAHYGVCQTLLRKKDRINVRFKEIERDFAAKFVSEPPFMRDVFINYEKLDYDLQKILCMAVQPLKNYLKALKIAGATFYLSPFHKFLWEAPHNQGLKGQRTFDLRLWDDIKGNGGFHSTSGADWEKDVKYLRFNVVAHEFAHQVHLFLSKKHREEIKWLFLKAKKERKTLDFYADFNEWEYFAVGVEAYVSPDKLADQKIGYGHTRNELLENDPDLYYFIEGLGNLESYEESEILAAVQKAMMSLRSEGKEKSLAILEESIEVYGKHPDFLDAMATVYQREKEMDKAKDMYIRAVDEFPDDSTGYLGLAEIYFYTDHDQKKAIALLEDSVERFSGGVDLLVKLGELYYFAAEVDKAVEVLQKALSIDPFPDPYSSSDPYYYLAKSFAGKEEYEKAAKLLDFSLAELDKNNLRVRAERAYVALMMEDRNAVQEHIDLAVTLRGRDARVQEIRALFLEDQGKREEARQVLEKLAEQRPNRVEPKIQLARMIMETDAGKAREFLDAAMANVDQIPDQILVSRLHTAYGLLEEKAGEIEKAIDFHKKAVALFKYNSESAAALARLKKGDKKGDGSIFFKENIYF